MQSTQISWNSQKTIKGLVLLILASVVLYSSSCKKSDNNDDDNSAPSATTIPPLTEGDGVMVSVKTISYITQAGMEFEVETGVATAAFGNLETGEFVDVGAIDLDANVLDKVDNNAYVYAPSATTPTGLDFGSTYEWNVAGGSGFSAFSHTVTFPFPTVGKITSPTGTISSGSSYTLTVQNVSNADSVLFQIVGSSGEPVLVTKAGNTTSHTFTAAEVASMGKGNGIIQVGAYTIRTDNKGGKTIHFVNETVATEFVEFD